ncbi:hypothetical protein ScalyP_jg10247 [Parmales sp. scaly parma]|nr:hypothetical protein ScalyP_jg10247 [Parmales sp. scaly parma]
MKVVLNHRNIELNGPTVRALNLTESLRNEYNFPDHHRSAFTNSKNHLFNFTPSAPDFGFLQSGKLYHYPLKLQTFGKDVVRFRVVQSSSSAPSSSHIVIQNQTTSLHVTPSTTKIIPGISVTLTLALSTLSLGQFNLPFTVISELETYTITVSGHVLSAPDFASLAPLATNGKTLTSSGVKFVKDLSTPAADKADLEADLDQLEHTHTLTTTSSSGEGARNNILDLFTQQDVDEASTFPTLSNMYWDKSTDTLRLQGTYDEDIVINEKKSLEEVIRESENISQNKNNKTENLGHLTSRCFLSLKIDQKVSRETFRSLASSSKEGNKLN